MTTLERITLHQPRQIRITRATTRDCTTATVGLDLDVSVDLHEEDWSGLDAAPFIAAECDAHVERMKEYHRECDELRERHEAAWQATLREWQMHCERAALEGRKEPAKPRESSPDLPAPPVVYPTRRNLDAMKEGRVCWVVSTEPCEERPDGQWLVLSGEWRGAPRIEVDGAIVTLAGKLHVRLGVQDHESILRALTASATFQLRAENAQQSMKPPAEDKDLDESQRAARRSHQVAREFSESQQEAML